MWSFSPLYPPWGRGGEEREDGVSKDIETDDDSAISVDPSDDAEAGVSDQWELEGRERRW